MPGRKRVPAELRVLHGRRVDVKIAGMPPVEKGEPAQPSRMSERAKAYWPDVCKLVDAMGVLSLADGMAVEALCEAYADFDEARDIIAKEGAIIDVVTDAGNIKQRPHPAVAMKTDADRRMRQWATEFGLTPAARVRLAIKNDKGNSKQGKAEKYFA